MKIFIFLFLAGSLSAQSVREKGKVFKSRPTYPYENINNSGLVIVKRTIYGLYFDDDKLSDSIKKRIEKFFRQQNKGYTDFKIYQLKIRRKNNDWFIDNYKF